MNKSYVKAVESYNARIYKDREQNGCKRIIPTTEAPEGIRQLAGRTPEVVEYTNPDGERVFWFIVDGKETKCPPVGMGR